MISSTLIHESSYAEFVRTHYSYDATCTSLFYHEFQQASTSGKKSGKHQRSKSKSQPEDPKPDVASGDVIGYDRETRRLLVFEPNGTIIQPKHWGSGAQTNFGSKQKIKSQRQVGFRVRKSLLTRFPRITLDKSLRYGSMFFFSYSLMDILRKQPNIQNIHLDLIPFLVNHQFSADLNKSYLSRHPTSLTNHSQLNDITDAHSEDLSVSESVVVTNTHSQSALSLSTSSFGLINRFDLTSLVNNQIRCYIYIPPNQFTENITCVDRYLFATSILVNTIIIESLTSYRPTEQPIIPGGGKNKKKGYYQGSDCDFQQPNMNIGPKCIIGDDVKITSSSIKDSILGKCTTVGTGSKIISSIIMEKCTIGENVTLKKCIIGANVHIGNNVSLSDCFIGHGGSILSDSTEEGIIIRGK